MNDGPQSTNRNARVTMAVLGVKIDGLTDTVKAATRTQEKLWTSHTQVHQDQEARLRILERLCHNPEPVNKRIHDLEKWQEGEKVRTGKVAAIQTSISAAISSAVAYLLSRPPSS